MNNKKQRKNKRAQQKSKMQPSHFRFTKQIAF